MWTIVSNTLCTTFAAPVLFFQPALRSTISARLILRSLWLPFDVPQPPRTAA